MTGSISDPAPVLHLALGAPRIEIASSGPVALSAAPATSGSLAGTGLASASWDLRADVVIPPPVGQESALVVIATRDDGGGVAHQLRLWARRRADERIACRAALTIVGNPEQLSTSWVSDTERVRLRWNQAGEQSTVFRAELDGELAAANWIAIMSSTVVTTSIATTPFGWNLHEDLDLILARWHDTSGAVVAELQALEVAPTWTDAYGVNWATAVTPDVRSSYWLDVTSDARIDAGISCSRGRTSDLGNIQAGSLVATLDNRDRRYDPDNTNGPHYGDITTGTPVQLLARSGSDEWTIWTGEVRRWSSSSMMSGDETVTIEATDRLTTLAQVRLMGDWVEYAKQLDPIGLWPMDEESGPFLDASDTAEDLVVKGTGTVTRALSAPFGGGRRKGPRFGVDSYADTTAIAAYDQTAATLVAWVRPPVTGGIFPNWVNVDHSTGATWFALGTDPLYERVIGKAGSFALTSEPSLRAWSDDEWLMVAIAADFSRAGRLGSAVLYVAGEPVHIGAAGLVTLTGTSKLTVNPSSVQADIAAVGYFPRQLGVAEIRGLAEAGKSGSFAAEQSGDIVRRLCDIAGIRYRQLDTGVAPMATYAPTGTALSAANTAAASEVGDLFADSLGRIRFFDRYHRAADAPTPAFTLSDTASGIPYDGILELTIDDDQLASVVEATSAPIGASAVSADVPTISRRGLRTLSVDAPVADADELRLVAQEVLTRVRYADRTRVRSASVTPSRDPDTIAPAVFGLELVDRVELLHTYGDGTTKILDAHVAQVSHSVGRAGWRTRFGLEPGDVLSADDAAVVFHEPGDAADIVDGAPTTTLTMRWDNATASGASTSITWDDDWTASFAPSSFSVRIAATVSEDPRAVLIWQQLATYPLAWERWVQPIPVLTGHLQFAELANPSGVVVGLVLDSLGRLSFRTESALSASTWGDAEALGTWADLEALGTWDDLGPDATYSTSAVSPALMASGFDGRIELHHDLRSLDSVTLELRLWTDDAATGDADVVLRQTGLDLSRGVAATGVTVVGTASNPSNSVDVSGIDIQPGDLIVLTAHWTNNAAADDNEIALPSGFTRQDLRIGGVLPTDPVQGVIGTRVAQAGDSFSLLACANMGTGQRSMSALVARHGSGANVERWELAATSKDSAAATVHNADAVTVADPSSTIVVAWESSEDNDGVSWSGSDYHVVTPSGSAAYYLPSGDVTPTVAFTTSEAAVIGTLRARAVGTIAPAAPDRIGIGISEITGTGSVVTAIDEHMVRVDTWPGTTSTG